MVSSLHLGQDLVAWRQQTHRSFSLVPQQTFSAAQLLLLPRSLLLHCSICRLSKSHAEMHFKNIPSMNMLESASVTESNSKCSMKLYCFDKPVIQPTRVIYKKKKIQKTSKKKMITMVSILCCSYAAYTSSMYSPNPRT